MNKLESELQRLYCLPGQEVPRFISDTDNPSIDLIGPSGLVRCCVVSVEKGSDWESVAALYQGVQEDLDLPAPAISVSGKEGYQVWFSLAEPVIWQKARDFMLGLCRKNLPEIKTAQLKFRPGDEGELRFVSAVPARLKTADGWSAYIDPSMGSMFVEETWLEMAPSLEKQAGLLAGLESIKLRDFQRVLTVLSLPIEMKSSVSEHSPPILNNDSCSMQPRSTVSLLNIGSGFNDPKQFLLAVMNDASATADQRIAAAIALLPIFEKASEQ